MRLLALIAVGLFAGAVMAEDKKEEKKVKDEEAILGTWKLERSDSDTWNPPPEVVEKVRLTFAKDGKLTVEGLGSEGKAEEEFKLGPAAKLKTIDLTFEKSLLLGAYDLDGDTLKLCCQLDVPIGEKFTRPEEVKADPKKWTVLLTFKRVEDEKKDK